MVVEVNIFVLIPVVVAVFYTIRWIDTQVRKVFRIDADSGLLEKNAELYTELEQQRAAQRKETESLRREYERKLTGQQRELQKHIDWLLGQIQEECAKIKLLETRIDGGTATLTMAKPLLLICGGISQFCTADRMAVHRAGVPFHRIIEATKHKIDDEFRRRRADHTLYKWVHISSHAGADGVLLADGVANAEWWHEVLVGVQVLFLAACETVEIADALAGMMTVISTTEEIEDKHAADFTYIFWRQMKEHGRPERAYQEALLAVPQVAEFTDIRLGGDNYGSDNE